MGKIKNFIKKTKAFREYINLMNRIKYRKMNKAVQTYGIDSISQICKLLNGIGIPCIPFFGTLLGLIRNGRIIEHDDDIDLVILLNKKEDWELVIKSFNKIGFTLAYNYSLHKQITELTFFKKDLRIDVFGCKQENDQIVLYSYFSKDNYSYPNAQTKHCMEHRYNFLWCTTSELFNGREIEIPKLEDSENLLAQMYGNDWRTPNPNWVEKESDHEKELSGCFGIFRDYTKK